MLLEKDAGRVPVLIGLLFKNEHSPHPRSPYDPSLISAPSLTEEGRVGCTPCVSWIGPPPSLSVGFPVCRRERDWLDNALATGRKVCDKHSNSDTQLKSPWEHLFLHTGNNQGVLQGV